MSPVIPHFELAEDSSDGGAHIIRVSGEIHVSTAPEFAQRLSAAIDSGKTAVVLDMAGVEFIDSSGLRSIIQLRNRADVEGVPLTVTGLTPAAQRVLELTGLISELRRS